MRATFGRSACRGQDDGRRVDWLALVISPQPPVVAASTPANGGRLLKRRGEFGTDAEKATVPRRRGPRPRARRPDRLPRFTDSRRSDFCRSVTYVDCTASSCLRDLRLISRDRASMPRSPPSVLASAGWSDAVLTGAGRSEVLGPRGAADPVDLVPLTRILSLPRAATGRGVPSLRCCHAPCCDDRALRPDGGQRTAAHATRRLALRWLTLPSSEISLRLPRRMKTYHPRALRNAGF